MKTEDALADRGGAFIVALVAFPAALTSLIRPSAWQLPVPGSVYTTLSEPGPITGVAAAPDGSLYVAKNGRDVYRVAPNRETRRIAVVPGPWGEIRLKYRQDNPYWLPDADPYAAVIRQGTLCLEPGKIGPDGLLYARQRF